MICIDIHGDYPGKPFKAVAIKAWVEFFRIADDSTDVAHWFIEADSATVRLSARRSTVDESDFDWTGLEPIRASVDGIIECLDASPMDEWDGIRSTFRAWVEGGILEAFESKRVKKGFVNSDANKSAFAVVTSTTDWGLNEDKLSLIWRSNRSVSISRIKAQQIAAKKRRESQRPKKGRIVKKRSS